MKDKRLETTKRDLKRGSIPFLGSKKTPKSWEDMVRNAYKVLFTESKLLAPMQGAPWRSNATK